MSKKFVSLNTICSHIRSNHKLTIAKTFQALKSYNKSIEQRTLQSLEDARKRHLLEQELKITKLVTVFEKLQRQRA